MADGTSDSPVLSLFDDTSMCVLDKCDGGQLLLIGSAHAGMGAEQHLSVELHRWKPDVGAVELCPARYTQMIQAAERPDALIPAAGAGMPHLPSLAAVGTLLASLPLALITAAASGETYGGDMTAAVQYAREAGALVYLADRGQGTTLSRITTDPGAPWHAGAIAQMMLGLALKSDGVLADGWAAFAAGELATYSPNIPPPMLQDVRVFGLEVEHLLRTGATDAGRVETLLRALPGTTTAALLDMREKASDRGADAAMMSERDEWMAHTLFHAPGARAAAVVGLGHFDGIKANWGTVTPQRMAELSAPPSDFYVWNAGVPLLALGGTAYGVYRLHRHSPRAAWAVGGGILAGAVCSVAALTAIRAKTESLCDAIAKARKEG